MSRRIPVGRGPGKRVRHRPSLQVEAVEARLLLAVITVNTALDENNQSDPTLSLREAIEVSNGTLPIASLSPAEQLQVVGPLSNPNTINFAIPGTGPFTIAVTSQLPTITAPVIIDGYSQPGSSPNNLPNGDNAVLMIVVNGSSASPGTSGLVITAGACTVQGLVIDQFAGDGLSLVANGGNTIQGNFIGTDVSGGVALGNQGEGIRVESPSNTIGGTTPAARNVIAGNGIDGISLTDAGAAGNLVQGNFIGTDATGTRVLGNIRHGVSITSTIGTTNPSGTDNTVGGTAAGAGNVIAGNGGFGVVIFGPNGGASGNFVQGNLIGTDATGTQALGNIGDGVVLSSAPGNTVGGATPTARNVIAGNGRYGVVIESSPSMGNLVQGNFIGTDATGTTALGNGLDGVIINGASSNTIGGTSAAARNVISGNVNNGVDITGSGAAGNTVQGNFIGTDATGSAPLGNGQFGILVAGATRITIGGPASTPGAAPGNVISANTQSGIALTNGVSQVTVQGNLIGTDQTGTFALGNGQHGIFNQIGASNNAYVNNVISANGQLIGAGGVSIFGSSTGNLVQGNLIGTDITGTRVVDANLRPLGNGFGVGIAGDNALVGGNIISGNLTNGVQLLGGTGNVVRSNDIGTDPTGTLRLGNGGDGVFVNGSNDTIGPGNLIAANARHGVEISGAGAAGNAVLGNFIGTTGNGRSPLGNGLDGVLLDGAGINVIGDPAIGGNIIAGNFANGVEVRNAVGIGGGPNGSIIQDNFIGTGAGGAAPLGNAMHGILIAGSHGLTVAQNVLSANGSVGLALVASSGVAATGNLIGTDATGHAGLGNSYDGVFVVNSVGNAIGASVQGGGGGNVISGNAVNGVELLGTSNGNTVAGNFIGTDATGLAAIPNNNGVLIDNAGANAIGGPSAGGNLIAGNVNVGIMIGGLGGTNNLVQGNLIGTDASGNAALPNYQGVVLVGGSFNTIGPGNVISGNNSVGVQIFNDATVFDDGVHIFNPFGAASNNSIQGNLIGTNAAGTAALPNGQGVFINDASSNTIGGVGQRAGNVISGNRFVGVQILGDNATGNTVQGNTIGTDATGTRNLGSPVGVFVYAAPGNAVGAGNVIVNNAQNVGNRALADGPTVEVVTLDPGNPVTGLAVTFTTYLAPARALDPANYVVGLLNASGVVVRRIPVTGVTYSTINRTAHLTLTAPIPLNTPFEVIVVGTGPNGLTDRVGNFLNGTNTVRTTNTGTKFVVAFRNGQPVFPATALPSAAARARSATLTTHLAARAPSPRAVDALFARRERPGARSRR